MAPPLVDSDWSALCQTLYDGVEQEEWVTMYNVLRGAATVSMLALDVEHENGRRTGLF